MEKTLKILWKEPEVLFKGKGIITQWREHLESLGWNITQDEAEIDSCDLVFFGSDSQLKQELIGKIPSILYFWGWHPERMHLDKLEMMVDCTRILVPSIGTRDQATMMGLPSLLCLPGVDTSNMDVVPKQPKKGQVVFCGRLVDHKHPEMLIEAMSFIEPSPDVIILGPGSEKNRERLKELSQRVGFTGNLIFGEPDDLVKFHIMKESLALVHPSEYEGWGLPPMEAILCGTPAFVLDTPHNRWVFKEDAFYFESPQEIAILLSQCCEDGFTHAHIRTAQGYMRFRERNSLTAIGDRLWAHIHQTIKEFLAEKLRTDPEAWKEVYDAEHRRNWAYGGETSPESACGPARFDPTWSRHWRAQYFIMALKETGCNQIIDIGCGPVYPTIFAKEGFEVDAIDISTEAIDQVMAVAEKWGVGHLIKAQAADAHALPYQDGVFDAAVLGEILEHVPDPEKILAEAIRVTKAGGTIVATTPIGTHHYDPMHFNIFDNAGMEKLVDEVKHLADLRYINQISEDGCDPSCYVMILSKKGEV